MDPDTRQNETALSALLPTVRINGVIPSYHIK